MTVEFFRGQVYDITGDITMPNLILLYYYSGSERRLLQVICTPEDCFVAARELALYMTDSDQLAIQFCQERGYPEENRKRDFCVNEIKKIGKEILHWYKRAHGHVLPRRYNIGFVVKHARDSLIEYCANKMRCAYHHFMVHWKRDMEDIDTEQKIKRIKQQ